MEINVTKSSLDLAKAVLNAQLQLCATLKKQIRAVEAQGASTSEGPKTSGKKAPAAKKTTKAAAPVAAKKAAKKAATPKKAATEKKVHRGADGKKISLKTRVLDYVTKTYTSDEVWSPKILLSKDEFEGTGNVHLSQVLKDLCGEGESGEKKINKISKGKYQTI